ncbi:MAG TPA: hypothetical protein VEK08_14970 [Planctomycetota bacterium]|nr:hypothetical protein [Planctomycetota bacterium]
MIRPEKFANAMYAFQCILIRARFMAYTNEPHERIAAILDTAEYLPHYFVCSEDKTEEFEMWLKDTAEKFSDAAIIDKFYEANPRPC